MTSPIKYRVSPIGDKVPIKQKTYYVVFDIASDPIARLMLKSYALAVGGKHEEEILKSLEIAEEMALDIPQKTC